MDRDWQDRHTDLLFDAGARIIVARRRGVTDSQACPPEVFGYRGSHQVAHIRYKQGVSAPTVVLTLVPLPYLTDCEVLTWVDEAHVREADPGYVPDKDLALDPVAYEAVLATSSDGTNLFTSVARIRYTDEGLMEMDDPLHLEEAQAMANIPYALHRIMGLKRIALSPEQQQDAFRFIESAAMECSLHTPGGS